MKLVRSETENEYWTTLEKLDPADALKPDSAWCPPGPDEWTPDLQRFALAMLRQPFPDEVVGLLPKPYRKDSAKSDCDVCGSYHGQPAVHLPYVGHASVTDRLLTVDPWWDWAFLVTDEEGMPVLDSAGNMWITLTIAGVTRKGYGDGDDPKVRIGDAIRNAGMRFGIALELWTKDELESLIGAAKTTRKAAPRSSTAIGGGGTTRATRQDPRTAGKNQLAIDDRNQISRRLSELEVRGPAVPKRLGEILGIEEGVSLSKLTTEDGPKVFEALDIPLPKPEEAATGA